MEVHSVYLSSISQSRSNIPILFKASNEEYKNKKEFSFGYEIIRPSPFPNNSKEKDDYKRNVSLIIFNSVLEGEKSNPLFKLCVMGTKPEDDDF